MARASGSWVVIGLIGSVAALGCRKKDEPEPQSAYQQPSPYAQPTATAAPTATAQPTADPNLLQSILAGALSGAQATLGVATGGEVGPIQSGIQMQASSVAKGARPEGELMSSKLAENGHAQAQFMMQPGRCYTVIGFGGLGVFEYAINLTTSAPLPPQVLAQSQPGAANQPVVGANDTCIRNPTPIAMPVTVDMHLVKGQGMVGAQVYAK